MRLRGLKKQVYDLDNIKLLIIINKYINIMNKLLNIMSNL